MSIKILNIFGNYNSKSNKYANYRNANISFMGNRTQNEKDFAQFKSQLARKSHKLRINMFVSFWDYYINSTKENQKKSETDTGKFLKLASDKNIYKHLLDFNKKGIKDKTLKRTIDDLLGECKLEVTGGELSNKLNEYENKIATKVNAYKGKIDGKEYSNADLRTILHKEKDPILREKAYNALYPDICEQVAPDLVKLVKGRNVYAKQNGYDNYYSLLLKEEFDVDEKELFKTLDNMIEHTMPIYKAMQDKQDAFLSKTFGIKPEEFKPWHYGLLSDDDPTIIANKYIKDNKSMENIVYHMYNNMGWDVKSMPITFDLYPKQNKNQHGMCLEINPNKDVRILANLKNNVDSTETLAHELGHAVYGLNYSPKIQYFDKDAHHPITEAVAMMMAALLNREGVYVKELNLPKNLANKLEVKRLEDSLKFMHSSAIYMKFEQGMYENPDQDLGKLWFELNHKYRLQNMPKKLNNEWAGIPHYLFSPAYCQNYFRAEIMQNQFYDTAHKALGNLTENKDTAKFFENKLFKYGKSLKEADLLKKFTGSSLNSDALCESYKTILKYIK